MIKNNAAEWIDQVSIKIRMAAASQYMILCA